MLETVVYLFSLETNIRSDNDYAVKNEKINQKYEIVEYLVSLGTKYK